MLQKTRGIVLHVTDYAESSIIAKIYTETYGLKSYLVNGVRKNKARYNNNLFQPLTLVSLVAYHKHGKGLHRIKEISCDPQYTSIPYHFAKSSLVIFINELLYKSIREEEANETLFGFLFHALQILDMHTEDFSCFHLFIMGQLSRYFGFYPHGSYSETDRFFNLQEGVYENRQPSHPYYLSGIAAEKFDAFMKADFANYGFIPISAAERKELLHALILYYELHITHGLKIQSHRVLEEIMQE